MAGRQHGERRHRADPVGVAILEQAVELAAVALELGALVEDLAEHLLHDLDVLADAELAAELPLNVGRRRKVVRVRVRLDQPFNLEAVLVHEVDDPVGRLVGDAAGRVIDVHDAIDDGAGIRLGILHHIADRVGRLIEERRDFGLHVEVHWMRDRHGCHLCSELKSQSSVHLRSAPMRNNTGHRNGCQPYRPSPTGRSDRTGRALRARLRLPGPGCDQIKSTAGRRVRSVVAPRRYARPGGRGLGAPLLGMLAANR